MVKLRLAAYCFHYLRLHNSWKVPVFQFVDPFGKGFRGIAWFYLAGSLENNIATVIVFIYIVDGYAGLGFGGMYYCLVHIGTIHSFPSIAG